MNISNRRTFMLKLAASSAVLVVTGARGQATGPALEETDPQATALGYKKDTAKVDGKKYPKHETSQTCANCQLFQGKATDAAGACSLFPGKQVEAKGWCSAWVKKAA